MGRPYKDLTGLTFGRWTVLSEAEPIYNNSSHLVRRWNCQCNCKDKTKRIVLSNSLTKGHSTSCGCIRKERAAIATSNARKGYNTFCIKDNYCEVFDQSGNKFLIDIDDIELVKQHYFYVDKSNGYVHTHIWDSENKKDYKMSLNVYLMGEKYADHINHDPSDNRRCNLRIKEDESTASNQSHNSINHRLRSDNKSGYTGVFYSKRDNKWIAFIGLNGKTINLGTYILKEDAILARNKGLEEYYPGWSYSDSINKNNIIKE